MTRGNWQRRVELNDARRQDAKQKKQRNEEKKLWKAQAQTFLSVLDKNQDSIITSYKRRLGNRHDHGGTGRSIPAPAYPGVIHFYTDTLPSDSPPILDLWEEDHQQKGNRKGRGRSSSIENEKVARTPNSGKKKHHPRSKESQSNQQGDGPNEGQSSALIPKLCLSHFFQGKCLNSGKKGGGKRSSDCRYIHYPKVYKSLSEVLTTSISGQEFLSASHVSYLNSSMPSTNGDTNDDETSKLEYMEMIYYFSLSLDDFLHLLVEEDNESTSLNLSSWLVESMAKRGCNLGSLVYLVLEDKLLFDRYQNGSVIQHGDWSTSSEVTAGIDGDAIESNLDNDIARSMPASVLEYVLAFLEDPAVAAMSSVCKAWNQEIGRQSGDLWRTLLKRREWPFPSVSAENFDGIDREMNTREEATQLRSSFTSHYTAMRLCRSIKEGVDVLSSNKRNSDADTSSFCLRSFDAMENAPREGNYCVSVKMFGENKMLAAYRLDCTLRLFEQSGSKLCRELLCYNIDPYRNTRKRDSNITAMSLDEQCVGCLLQISEVASGAEATLLAVVTRDALLMADDSLDNESTKVIDVNQSVLNYLLSCEHADHGLLQLIDFVGDGGELDDVEILVSRSIESCGYGRFLVEVSVAIPLDDATDDDDSDAAMTILFRKLFLFSSSAEAIIWMCDSNPLSRPIRPRHDDMTLKTLRTEENGRIGCYIIAASAQSPGIMSGSIDASGDFIDPVLIEESNSLLDSGIEGQWCLRTARHRAIAVINHVVVMADNLVRTEDEVQTYKSILRFHSLDNVVGGGEYSASLTIAEDVQIRSLIRLGDDHVIAMGVKTVKAPNEGNDNGNPLNDVDGQWFGEQVDNNDETPVDRETIIGIVIDVISKTEIFRTEFADNSQFTTEFLNDGDLPFQLDSLGETLVAGAWWKGIVMSGVEAHSHADLNAKSTTPGEAKSKKKKKGPKRGGKKDGFARGMSLRG